MKKSVWCILILFGFLCHVSDAVDSSDNIQGKWKAKRIDGKINLSMRIIQKREFGDWQFSRSFQKSDFKGSERNRAVGFSIDDKGYIGTGRNFSNSYNFYKDFWEYDPKTDIWTQKADLYEGERSDAVGFSIGSKGYIGTGYCYRCYEDNIHYFYGDFWEYSP